MTHESHTIGYWQRLNNALTEVGEAPLGYIEVYDLYNSRLSYKDVSIRTLLGVEQSASPALINAFDRLFGSS